MNRPVLWLVLAMVIPALAQADTWNPWRDQLVVAPGGRYYVVMRRTGGPKVYGEWGPVEYIICERGAGTPPVMPAQSSIVELGVADYDEALGGQLYEIKSNAEVRVRHGDNILGRGNLKRPPLRILVSDTGLGFAGLDVHGYNYGHNETGLKHDHAVIIVASGGNTIHRKSLVDLFTTRELDGFDTTAGGIRWLYGRNPGWINDATKQLVVVGDTSEAMPNRHLVRIIDWHTGQIARGPTQVSQDALEKFEREQRERKR